MLIGETSSISDETKVDFQKAGITHLLAVSGSNVALVITFSNIIIVKLFGKRYSDFISIIFIVFFISLSGSSPSVVRAGIMAILNLIANIFSKKPNSINNLISSSFFILIYNPLSILNIGFLLSFAGTVGILVFLKEFQNFVSKYIKISFIAETISLNFSAQIIIFPITLYFFNSISFVGILANLFIVPVTSILTFLGILLLLISLLSFKLASIISFMINPIINYVLTISRFFSDFDFLNFNVPTPKIWMIAVFYILVYFEYDKCIRKKENYLLKISNMKIDLIKDTVRKILYRSMIFLTIFAIFIKIFPKNYIEFTAIDVGQGDSFLIITEYGKKILIDGGGSETSDYDVGKNVLMPYLFDRGYAQIDYIFLSHAHADHIDGIYTVLENFNVKTIFIGPQMESDEMIEKLRKIAAANHVKIVELHAGNIVKIDDLKFEILFPSSGYVDANVNNLSLIIKAICNDKSILFTGDAEEKVEEELLKKYETNTLDIDILKVGHHGAKTSSSDTFIKAVSPDISIISVAKDNSYGHPNSEVVERLKNCSKVLMTSELGEINLKIYKNGDVKVKNKIK